MTLRVIITRDFDHMSEVAAGLVQQRIQDAVAQRDACTLGLATGNSPTGLYKWLAKAANAGQFDPSKITSFNLDEYVGLPGRNPQARALHPESYSYFMIQELFGLLHTKFAQTHVPWGCVIDQDDLMTALEEHPQDWEQQGEDAGQAIVISPQAQSPLLRQVRTEILDAYADQIAAAGGVDVHVIGVGGRGHVAFHESGIPFAGNRMLLVKLDDDTLANAVTDGHFCTTDDCMRYAVTMGTELIFQARTVVLVANGSRKAEPVAASLADEVSEAVPLSYAQRYAAGGGEMIYVIDAAAATDVLTRRAEIEARGVVIEDRRAQQASRPVSALTFSRDPETGSLS